MKSSGLFSDFHPPACNGKIVTMKAGKGHLHCHVLFDVGGEAPEFFGDRPCGISSRTARKWSDDKSYALASCLQQVLAERDGDGFGTVGYAELLEEDRELFLYAVDGDAEVGGDVVSVESACGKLKRFELTV